MFGAFDRKRTKAKALVERVIESLVPPDAPSPQVVASSPKEPAVVCAYLEGLSPPLIHRCRPDGSLVVLDGRVYQANQPVPQADRTCEAAPNGNLFDAILDERPGVVSAMDFAGSIACWNEELNQLTLYRDRSGIVPVYWAHYGSCLLWSSSLAAIQAAGVERLPFLPAVDFFLASGFVPSPWTFVRGVNKIPPGHCLRWQGRGDPRVEPYWQPSFRPKSRLDAAERTERLSELLTEAVRRRLGGGERIGALLSGGIDSALLVGIAARKLGAQVDSFTFDYTDYGGELNETRPARRIADFCGSRHHEITYGPGDFADNFEDMVRNYGEPLTYGVHSYLLRDVVASGTPALLVGSGPDGWAPYNIERYARAYASIPAPLRGLAERLLDLAGLDGFAPTAKLRTMHWCARTGLATTLATPLAQDRLRRSLFRAGVYDQAGRHELPEHAKHLMRALEAEDFGDRSIYSSLHFYSAEAVICWNHMWSRTHDIPIEHPYFDNDVVDFLMQLPERDQGKADFRRVAATFMPDDIAYAPKVYQALPIEAWFRGPLRDFVMDFLAPARLRRTGLFDERVVQGLIEQHSEGRRSCHWLLLAVMSLTVWLEQPQA